jgi:hypothetical protein
LEKLGEIIKGVFSTLARLLGPITPMVRDSAGFFGVLGKAISGLIGPALVAAVSIKGIKTAISGVKAVKNIGKTIGDVKDLAGAIKTTFTGVGHGVEGIGAALAKLTGSPELASKLADGFGLLTGKVSILQKAAEGNKFAKFLISFDNFKRTVSKGFGKVKDILADFGSNVLNTMKNAGTALGEIGGKIAGVTKALLENAAAALKVAGAWIKNTAKLVAHKIATVAMAAAQKAAALASKIWAGIQWAAQRRYGRKPHYPYYIGGCRAYRRYRFAD